MPNSSNIFFYGDQPNGRVTCRGCMSEVNRSDCLVLDGRPYCLHCHDEVSRACDGCDEVHHEDHIQHVRASSNGDATRNLCRDCFDNEDCNECPRCGRSFTAEVCMASLADLSDIYYCPNCLDQLEEEIAARDPKELQSKEPGKIIKSIRKIGIELECVYKKTTSINALRREIHPAWKFTNDGSLRINKDAIGTLEIISPIMSGKAAEDQINKIGLHAYKAGMAVNDSCGFHLHLDALDFKRDKKDEIEDEREEAVFYNLIDKKSKKRITVWTEEAYKKNKRDGNTDDPNIIFEAFTEKKPTTFTNRGMAFMKMRDLFYVYLAFDDVFRGMLPLSRRSNNFCKSTSSLYSLDAVRDLQDYGELEALWYKVDRRRKRADQIMEAESRKTGKDGSRYVGFNLEPLLRYQSQTIEIRYHSPTLNSEKILHWIDLHQTILDHISSHPLEERQLNAILASETHLIRKAKAMCKFFKIKKETEEWIMARLHKFNKIQGTDKDMEDEEVEESETGRPNHDPGTPMMRGGRVSPQGAGIRYELAQQVNQSRSTWAVSLEGNTGFPLYPTDDGQINN